MRRFQPTALCHQAKKITIICSIMIKDLDDNLNIVSTHKKLSSWQKQSTSIATLPSFNNCSIWKLLGNIFMADTSVLQDLQHEGLKLKSSLEPYWNKPYEDAVCKILSKFRCSHKPRYKEISIILLNTDIKWISQNIAHGELLVRNIHWT